MQPTEIISSIEEIVGGPLREDIDSILRERIQIYRDSVEDPNPPCVSFRKGRLFIDFGDPSHNVLLPHIEEVTAMSKPNKALEVYESYFGSPPVQIAIDHFLGWCYHRSIDEIRLTDHTMEIHGSDDSWYQIEEDMRQ